MPITVPITLPLQKPRSKSVAIHTAQEIRMHDLEKLSWANQTGRRDESQVQEEIPLAVMEIYLYLFQVFITWSCHSSPPPLLKGRTNSQDHQRSHNTPF